MTEGVALHEIIRNAAGDAIDYRILDVNRSYERHVEIPVDNVKGRLATALYGVDPAPYLDLYAGVAETRVSAELRDLFRSARQALCHFGFFARPRPVRHGF